MSTVSATGAWPAASRSFERGLAELREWRDAMAAELAAFRRWAMVARVLDEQAAARLAYLERRLVTERLTIAFVSEYSRGKSELINALFFGDLGRRLLPSGTGHATLCATEIGWDASRPASLRLLPIGTRETPKALREYLQDAEGWTEVALDPAQPEALTAALDAVTESIEVDAAHAADLGFQAEGAGTVRIPRWRYALVNFPHPLLAGGLVVLDTPGHNTLGTEPELTLRRVPDAAAIVFLLTAETGLVQADAELWSQHIAPIDGLDRNCFLVLNKIDTLREAGRGEGQVLAEIDRQVRATAEALGVEPTRVFALSARQALEARICGDGDGLLKSRAYRLEQALAKGTLHGRRFEHARAVQAEVRGVLVEARALLASRLEYAREQGEALAALQGKNQKLVESLAKKASTERSRIEQARAMLMGLKTLHGKLAGELTHLLDPDAVRRAGIEAGRAVMASTFSRGIGDALDGFFAQARERMTTAVRSIADVRESLVAQSRNFAREYRMATIEGTEFTTERFLVEIDRIEQRCNRDFRGATSLILHGRRTLAGLFFDTVVQQMVHVFEIADRETRTWMNAFVRPLESQVNSFQENANSRIEGMGRIQNAETDLVERMQELEGIAAEVSAQRERLEAFAERLQALGAVAAERSLA